MRNFYLTMVAMVATTFLSLDLSAQYCTPTGFSSTWLGLTEVSTTGASSNFSNFTAASVGYTDYSGTHSATVIKGRSFNVNVRHQRYLMIWVDWNADGDFTDAGEQTWSGSYINYYWPYNSYTHQINVPATAPTGNTRMRVAAGYYFYMGPCGSTFSSYAGEYEDYNLNVQPPPPNDAGVVGMPQATICPGTHDFDVVVENFGSNSITSVTLSGNFGATSYGPTTFTGLNIPVQGDTILTLGQFTAVSGNSYNVDATTSMPNGVTDGNSANDAWAVTGLSPAMSGTFTIGGTTPDYATFGAALTDLYNNGVCDTTIFNVRSGNYSNFAVFNIPGASALAPVIFQSDTANTTTPEITRSGSTVLEFDGASWVTFDGIDVRSTSTFGGRVIYFDNMNDNITIKNCNISKPTYTSTSTTYSCVYDNSGTSEMANDITFDNVSFSGGSYGIYAWGANTNTRQTGWVVENCTFSNITYKNSYTYYTNFESFSYNTINAPTRNSFTYYVEMRYSDNTDVMGNTMNMTNTNYGYGFYMYYNNWMNFEDNVIPASNSSSYRYNLYAYYCYDSYIGDNDFTLEGNRTQYGMYIYRCNRSLVEFNEITINSTGTTYGMWFYYPDGDATTSFVAANNVVQQPNLSGGTQRGMMIYYPYNYFQLLHNTVRMASTGSTSAATYEWGSGSTNGTSFRNNILINEGTGYAHYQQTSTNIPRDNNVYWSNGGLLAYSGGGRNDLTALQANGNDMGSFQHLPDFFSATDPHIFYDKVISDGGSAAATFVPEDWDGDARNALNPDPGIDEYQIPRNSVALVSIDDPVTPICALGGVYNVTLLNVGTGPLDSVYVEGTVDHLNGTQTLLNPTLYAPGTAVPSGSVVSINAGNYSTGFVNGDTLTLWVTSPNGVIDSILGDDTMSVVLIEGIRGTFTIGDTTVGTYDYHNFSHAQTLLDSVQAICDTVTFIVDDGTYNDNVAIPAMIGSAYDRPIIFKSLNGDASLVTLAANSGPGSAVEIWGDNVHFMDMSINHNVGTGRAVSMWDVNNVTFDNVNLANNYTGTSTNGAVFYAQGELSNVTLSNSSVSGGSYGVYVSGSSSNDRAEGIELWGLEIEDPYYRGIYLNNVEDAAVNYNTINSSHTYTSGRGINIQNTRGDIEVMNNTIVASDRWPERGFYFSTLEGTAAGPADVSNNVLRIGTNNYSDNYYGIYMTNNSFVSLVHNTIGIETTNSGSYGVYITGGGGNELVNNNIAHLGDGDGLRINGVFSVINSDNNNLWSANGDLANFNGSGATTISNWQNASGLGSNSVSADPMFYSSTDMRVCAADLDNAGQPTMIGEDFEGQNRDSNTPDIGADEFTSPDNFQLPDDTVICYGDVLTLDAALNTGTFVIWNNFVPGSSINISSSGVYKAFVSNTCGQALDSIVVDIAQPADLPADTHLCAGASVMVGTGVMNGSYMWSNGATTDMININSRGIYAVEVMDTLGCVTTDTIAVTQSRAVALPADTAFCDGNTLILNANVGQGSYFWSPTAETTPVIFVNKSGNYTVQYTDNMFCTSTDNINVAVTPEPMAGFNFFNSFYSISITDQSMDAGTYMYTFGDGDTSYVANPVHVYAGPGTYRVIQTVMNSCGTDVTEKTVVISALPGFDEYADKNGMKVYPNPSNGSFDVSLENVPEKALTLQVVSVDGKVVFSQDLEVSSDLYETHVDMGTVAAGVYYVKVSGNDYNEIQKVTIQ